MCGTQQFERTPIGRQQDVCVVSQSLTSNPSNPQTDDNSVESERWNVPEPLVDSLDGRSNGSEMIDKEATSTQEDRGSRNHANYADSSDQTADPPRQTADLPPPAHNVDLHVLQGDKRNVRRAETTEVPIQPAGASQKHVPTILRRQRPHKFHCHKNQQEEQQTVGTNRQVQATAKSNNKSIGLQQESECDSSSQCGIPEATRHPSGCSTDGNVSEGKLAGTVLTTQTITIVEESAIQGCDSKENTGSNNVEMSTTDATPKAKFAVPSAAKTERNRPTPKDARMVDAKVRPKPAAESSYPGRLVGDNAPTRNIATSGISNKSRRPLPGKAIVGTTAAVGTASGKTVPGSKPNGHCRGIVGCPSKAPSYRPIVAVSGHAGRDTKPKSSRCGVTKLAPRVAKGHHKVSTTVLGERRALATDRYAMDDAIYSIIAEKYRLFYRLVQ